MLLAVTRTPTDSLSTCLLSFLPRGPIEIPLARQQHAGYERCLSSLGCRIERVAGSSKFPDGTFVEDTAVVFPDCAILARPAALKRRAEVPSIARVLRKYREIHAIQAPDTLEGGDVLRIGNVVYAGISNRTNAGAVAQLEALLTPRKYTVETVEVRYCLHLKTAATGIGDDTVLINPEWIDFRSFSGFRIIPVHSDEPYAANALRIGSTVLLPSSAPKTRRRLEQVGYNVLPVDISELAKAEAGLTCCSLIFEHP